MLTAKHGREDLSGKNIALAQFDRKTLADAVRVGIYAIGARNKGKEELRPLGDRSVELGLGLCFQQKS